MASDKDGRATVLTVGSLLFHTIDRGGSLYLRVKDRESPLLAAFAGIDRFPVDDRWRVEARLEDGPEKIQVVNVLGQSNESSSPGVLVFKVKGRELRLTPEGEPGSSMFIVFGDETNGKTTYAGGRSLHVDPPDENGMVILDFNKAYNPPCVFTPYATCSLPRTDNILGVAVEAGEKMWGDSH